jgi:hypothetical protein
VLQAAVGASQGFAEAACGRFTSSAATRHASFALDFLECQRVQIVGSAHPALCQLDDLLRDDPCDGVVYHLQTQRLADALERVRHFGDCFGIDVEHPHDTPPYSLRADPKTS